MAGNASNWHKVTSGRLKGKRVYFSFAQMKQADEILTDGIDRVARKLGTTRAQEIVRQLGTGDLSPMVAPRGMAITAAAARIPSLGGTPVVSATPLAMTDANRVYISQGGQSYSRWDTSSAGGEDTQLKLLYTRQGFHAKPDVLTKQQIDAHVAAGEIEVFRGTPGTKGNPDAHSESYRSASEHYGGRGIYGNGTYTAVSRTEATNYAKYYGDGEPASGTVLRMTIKQGAKIGEYDLLEGQRQAALSAVQASYPKVYEAAIQTLFRQRKVFEDASGVSMSAASATARIRDLDAKVERVRARREREYPTAIYRDVGAYAVARGYDAITHRPDGDHGKAYIVLNRGATRVQDTSIRTRSSRGRERE